MEAEGWSRDFRIMGDWLAWDATAATRNTPIAGGTGARTCGGPITTTGARTPTAIEATIIMEATITGTCHLTTIVRPSTVGPTIRGPYLWFTLGGGEERPGTDTMATISPPIPFMQPRRSG